MKFLREEGKSFEITVLVVNVYIIPGVQHLKCKPGYTWEVLSVAPRCHDRLEQSRPKLKTSLA